MESLWKWMRSYVSPVFLVLLVASFILWYLSKLSYTYVAEQPLHLMIDDQPLEVTCRVEGLGSSLFAHRFHPGRTLHIPLEELQWEVSPETEGEEKLRIDPQSLQEAIAVRCNDMKILSVGAVPEIDRPQPKPQQ